MRSSQVHVQVQVSTSTSSLLSKNKIPPPLRFILASSIQMSTVTLGPGQLGQLATRRLDLVESENKTGQGKEIAKLLSVKTNDFSFAEKT